MDRQDFYNKRDNYRIGGLRKDYILSLVSNDVHTVLDVGCGNGELAESLKERCCRVTGVDVSQSAIVEAAEFLDDSFCFDIEKENWPEDLLNKKFDLIVASEVIEHIFDPLVFLKKIKSLSAPNGKIIITTPNVLFWKNRLKILFGDFKYQDKGIMDRGHIRFFTTDTFRDTLKKSGLSVVIEKNLYPNLYFRNLNWLGNLFPGLFAYQFVVLLSHE